MSDGYTITPHSKRSLARFRRTIPPVESMPVICPKGCTEKHDAEKFAGRDHWMARPKRT